MSQLIELADFIGLWRLERRIHDHLGPTGHLTGTATFTPETKGLRLTEQGQLTLGESSFAAERHYLWHADHSAIEVSFDDGRFFHRFAPQGVPTATHWCDPDQYDVTYDFSRWPEWSSTWRVKGPRKDYEMHSNYMR